MWTGTLKKSKRIYPMTIGKKVSRDAKLASVTYKVTSGQALLRHDQGGSAGFAPERFDGQEVQKKTKSVTVKSAPGNGFKLRVYSTSKL